MINRWWTQDTPGEGIGCIMSRDERQHHRCSERENLKQGNNDSNSLSSSKCVSMPSAPGTEQMSRAFRNVLHLLTRQQCPPSSFCRDKIHSSHPSSSLGRVWLTAVWNNRPIWLHWVCCYWACMNKNRLCISAWPICTGGQPTSTAEVKIQALWKWFMGWNSSHFMETKWFTELEDIHLVSIFIYRNIKKGRILFLRFLVVFSTGVTGFNIFQKETEMFCIVFIGHARGGSKVGKQSSTSRLKYLNDYCMDSYEILYIYIYGPQRIKPFLLAPPAGWHMWFRVKYLDS